MAEWELLAVLEQENYLKQSLTADEMAWRGLALNGADVDKKYFRHIDNNAEVEIKLNMPKRYTYTVEINRT